jgi:hypothetical protein
MCQFLNQSIFFENSQAGVEAHWLHVPPRVLI